MDISLHDVHQALVDLGKFRFGEMRVEDAIREIVHTTHAMFDVDGAGLMLVSADQHLRSIAASDDRFAHLEELQGALNSRQVIEQAKGVLMGQQGISARDAYGQLRAQARSERRKLAAVCAEVVANAKRSVGDLPPR